MTSELRLKCQKNCYQSITLHNIRTLVIWYKKWKYRRIVISNEITTQSDGMIICDVNKSQGDTTDCQEALFVL